MGASLFNLWWLCLINLVLFDPTVMKVSQANRDIEKGFTTTRSFEEKKSQEKYSSSASYDKYKESTMFICIKPMYYLWNIYSLIMYLTMFMYYDVSILIPAWLLSCI